MRLEPLDVWLELPEAGPLLPQLRQALRLQLPGQAVPLRWAITAVDTAARPIRRLRIEAVVLHPAG